MSDQGHGQHAEHSLVCRWAADFRSRDLPYTGACILAVSMNMVILDLLECVQRRLVHCDTEAEGGTPSRERKPRISSNPPPIPTPHPPSLTSST